MPDKHSSPPKPSATVAATTSSHSSPASTVSSTDPSARRSTRRPREEIRTTVPGHPASAITRLDPPPITERGLAQGVDHLVRGLRFDQPPGRAAEAQGGQRRERDGQIG